MAVTLKQSFVVNVGSIVQNAIDSAKRARGQEQSTKEAEFQKAVADGMSYDAQVAFRKKQIEDEQRSSIVDDDYVSQLQKSVADLAKLNRFSKYRAKYQKSFAELKAGRETAQEHLDILNSMLNTTSDPALREEIQGDLISAEADVKTYHDNILSNQVKKAQYDGTPSVLASTISQIKDRRAAASLAGNEEESTALDATLSVLNQQLNKVTIEDATDKLQVMSLSKGLSPANKLQAISGQIAAANNVDPVTVDGKTFASVADYWTQTRDAYLSGSGRGIFSDFFSEMSNTIQTKVNAAVARDGFATTLTLDGIKNEMTALKTKPEMVPFLEQVNNFESIAIADAFKTTAGTIIDRASYTGDFKTADMSLQDYSTKYGIDSSFYRLKLGDALTNQVNRVAGQTGKSPAQVEKESGLEGVLAASDFATPTPKTDAGQPSPVVPGGTARVFTAKENVELAAAQRRIGEGSGSAIDKQNVAYAKKQGWVDASVAPAAPVVPPPTAVTPVTPVVQPESAVAPPAPTVKPVTPAPTSTGTPASTTAATPAAKPYTGSSIVDYLKLQDKDTSFEARSKLAKESGLTDYTGTAEQNMSLLKKLQGGV